MNESPSMAIDALRVITEFLSDNSLTIVFLVLLIICRDAISSFISRLTSFKYKTGESELGMEAAAPPEDKEKNSDLRTADEKPSPEDKKSEIEKKEESWLPDMHKAFEEGRIEDAEVAFKKYALDEKDEVKVEENRAFYLYLRFEKGQDNSAIDELEKLSRTGKTEDSRFNTLLWLSVCLNDSMQIHKEIQLWRSTVEETKSVFLKTRAIVNLAYALNRDDSSVEAKKLLTDRLIAVMEDAQKALLYEALSKVEDTLGNKSLSVFCKDKSLEFDSNNRGELFNSAYAASDEDIDEISISNYIKLIRIDGNNSTALNNLGVRAQEAGLKIKAIDQYKKSSTHKNTLAMANQGYSLLGAGFTDEAEEIAKKALKQDEPHQNVHSLLAEINERKEKQNKDWEELSQKALSRQKIIREYTEQFYLGNPKLLEGNWNASGTYPMTIKIENDLLKASWVEAVGALGGGTYTVELTGKVSGSTFDGAYARKRNEGSPSTLLGLSGNTNQACIGYFSEKDREIKLVSKKLKDNFSLCLSQKKA
jgi:tetratricopeptide (TPR) repeat protein